MADVQLTAYNVKTKEKNVPIQDAVVTKTAKGAYMVQGHDGKGNKLTTLCNEEKAMAAIKAGVAKQGWQYRKHQTACYESHYELFMKKPPDRRFFFCNGLLLTIYYCLYNLNV